MSDYFGVDPRPVWCILGRGTPPFDFMGPGAAGVPTYARNRTLCMVDATTKELAAIMVGVPGVDPPKGWNKDTGEGGER